MGTPPAPPATIEVSTDTQRFVIAIILLTGFFICFAIVFLVTRDVEIAKTVLTVLATAIASVVSFFFGVKTAEMRR